MNQQRHSTRRQFGSIYFLILFGLILGFCYSPAFSSESWVTNLTPGELFNINPMNTQWLTIEGRLNAITLIDGKICIFETKEGEANWVETQNFSPNNIEFTIFQTKDINRDGLAEIIAGTAEPGFIYIYKYNNGKWDLFNYGKYVWSSINNIAVGNFEEETGNDILVQNQEGSLYLLKITDNSLDLVWKSPTTFKPISNSYVIDIDNDSKDEIMVVYKTGGVAILKIINNAVISVWENYLWGKVLSVTSGDWDQDQIPEIIIASSQKVIYFLGWTPEKGYQFEYQWSQLNYTIEKIVYLSNDVQNQLFATDTAGKFHFFEYNFKTKQWFENYSIYTGRIAEIINADPKHILLWGINRKIITIKAYEAKELKLKYGDQIYEMNPAVSVINDICYISPNALKDIPDLGLNIRPGKNSIIMIYHNKNIEINNKNLSVKLDKELIVLKDSPVLVDKKLFFSLETYQTLFGLNLTLDFENQLIQLLDDDSSTMTPDNPNK